MRKTLTTAIVGFALSASAQAEISWQQVDDLVAATQPQVVEWRRWFHENPELSNREFNTAARLAEILRGMGLEPKTGIAHTGLVAIIEGGKPGPMVAIRTDIDGLPVTERTGEPFASTATTEYNGQATGVMHACGHDTHMAMVLGAASVLNELRADLAGSVMLIFQPAEEGQPVGEEGGAELMLKEGIFEQKPAAVFGAHVWWEVPAMRLAVHDGPAMAAADRFTIKVTGKQSHGSQPWNGIDPIVVAAQIVMGLQTIASRQVNVTLAPSVISLGMIHGGIRNNIIPDDVELVGTIRTFNQEMRDDIHARVRRTAVSIAESAGATATVDIPTGTPSLVNSRELVAALGPTFERVAGEQGLYPFLPVTAAEDFAFFSNQVPAIYFFIGAVAPGVDYKTSPGNHSPLFNVYEPVMEIGVQAFTHAVVDYLQAQ